MFTLPINDRYHWYISNCNLYLESSHFLSLQCRLHSCITIQWRKEFGFKTNLCALAKWNRFGSYPPAQLDWLLQWLKLQIRSLAFLAWMHLHGRHMHHPRTWNCQARAMRHQSLAMRQQPLPLGPLQELRSNMKIHIEHCPGSNELLCEWSWRPSSTMCCWSL